MNVNDDVITFSSGRTLQAFRGFVGISIDNREDARDIKEGFDGTLFKGCALDVKDDFDVEPCMTVDERVELAEYMARRWIQYAKAARAETN